MIIITVTNCWYKVSHLQMGWKDQNGRTEKHMKKDLRKLELSEKETKDGGLAMEKEVMMKMMIKLLISSIIWLRWLVEWRSWSNDLTSFPLNQDKHKHKKFHVGVKPVLIRAP